MLLHAVPGRCRLRIAGLSDPQVRAEVEHRLQADEQVRRLRINPACDSLVVEHRGPTEAIVTRLQARRAPTSTRRAGAGARSKLVPLRRPAGEAEPLRALACATASLLLAPLGAGSPLALLPLVLSGVPIWRRALETLVQERRLNVDFLDGLALAITVLRGQAGTGALMAWMVHFGDWMRERTARQSQAQLRDLLDFQAVQARRLSASGRVQLVPADALRPDDQVLVMSGDLVPADGAVASGTAALDQRHITGESMPATCGAGDAVYAGSTVIDGSLTLRVQQAGADTVAARIVKLVASAPAGETRMQNYAERFADKLVAPLLGVNAALLAATGNVDRFLSLAIVDYGTGIRVAAPTSVLASMTRAAREGILIKSGRHVELLAGLRGVAFDKTGTLTRGRLAVLGVQPLARGLSAERLLQLAAAPEAQLRHPVARALVAHAQAQGLALPACENVDFTIGLGVAGLMRGRRVLVGSERFLRSQGVATAAARAALQAVERQGHAALLVALDDELAGLIAYSDEIRPEAPAVLAGLHQRGVRQLVLVTGDRAPVAQRIAKQLGISRMYAEVLPAEKAEIVHALRAEGSGPLAMVGDGVNDSPALAQADVGVSLAEGADIARDAADVVLMHDGLHGLPQAIDISRQALALVRQNYAIIAGFNTLALALALPSGWVSPAASTLLSNGSAVLAGLNAMRPLLPAGRRTRPLAEAIDA